jgi:hypothetical protein
VLPAIARTAELELPISVGECLKHRHSLVRDIEFLKHQRVARNQGAESLERGPRHRVVRFITHAIFGDSQQRTKIAFGQIRGHRRPPPRNAILLGRTEKIRLEANIFFVLPVASSMTKGTGNTEEAIMSSLAELQVSAGEDPRAALVHWIRIKREKLETYLTVATSRRRRWLNLTVIAGTLAAALTAAPALGGKPVADWLTVTFGLSSPAWRLLCAAAMACSLTATITTQLVKSHSVDEHVSRAQAVRARLEMLEFGLASRGFDYADTAEECLQCIKDMAFIDEP